MRSQLIWCIAVNILAALLSIGVLYLYPAGRRFTVGYGTAHFIQGGTFIAALCRFAYSQYASDYFFKLLSTFRQSRHEALQPQVLQSPRQERGDRQDDSLVVITRW
jgi:hypothetical protein